MVQSFPALAELRSLRCTFHIRFALEDVVQFVLPMITSAALEARLSARMPLGQIKEEAVRTQTFSQKGQGGHLLGSTAMSAWQGMRRGMRGGGEARNARY